MHVPRVSLPLFCAAAFLTGCGFTANTIAPVHPAANGVHGKIMGGQQPIIGSLVSVYALGAGGAQATLLATTTTDQSGSFAFGTGIDNSYVCPAGPVVSDAHSVAQARAKSVAQKTATEPTTNAKRLIVKGEVPADRSRTKRADLIDLTQAYTYITATGGDAGGGANSSILLAAGLGACADGLDETVELNEVSSVAFATAMLNYAYGGSSFGAEGSSTETITAMDEADTSTFKALVNLSTGLVQPNVVSTAPGGTSVTIDAGKIYSMANAIASCVNSADTVSGTTTTPSSACQALYGALYSYGYPVTNTLDAVYFTGITPDYNVATLWGLGNAKAPFAGGLSSPPNDWTLGIAYTTSAMGLGLFPDMLQFPTSSNIDIDSNGNIWFPSNKAGATGAGYFDPTELAFNGPFGGSNLVQPQYVAVNDGFGLVFVTDLESNNVGYIDTTPGAGNAAASFTISDKQGGPYPQITGPIYYYDDADTINLSYFDSLGNYDYVYLNWPGLNGAIVNDFNQGPTGLILGPLLGSDYGDPHNPVAVAATDSRSAPCGLEVAGDPSQDPLPGPLLTSTNPCASGGAATGTVIMDPNGGHNLQDEVTAATTANQICSQLLGACFSPTAVNASNETVNLANGPVGLAFDGQNELWMANSGNASIAKYRGDSDPGLYDPINATPFLHGSDNGGTMSNPTGIAIDGAGNVWVSNATCSSPTDTTCSFTLSEVIGVAYPTITPLGNQASQLQGTEPGARENSGVGPNTMVPLRVQLFRKRAALRK